MTLETKQEIIGYCISQIIYYLGSIVDCNDYSFLRYYQGKVVAHRETLANLGYGFKIDIELEPLEC